uniref:Calponin-homology (CH) domain-containing protein n=1 Tax=Neogobius melanostomus TaxID=47308 RepID=A0A8C6WEV1_9GOBI
MEWRQQTSLSCTDAFVEAQRWIEEVTGKSFDCIDFRAALENGVLLSDLINQLKPGIIKRVNRLSTPIAGLDNVSVFLKACGKLGLNESQLFHPGDLQDLSSRVTLKRDEGNRRLKNVLITIYWLGRKANQDGLYKGPQLNFKSFEGLLGLALSRSLDDGSNYCPEKDDAQPKTPNYKRYSSVDSAISPDGKAHATNGEGCGSDAEAEQVFKMETSHVLAQSNKGYLPLLQKVKQAQGGRGCASPLSRSKSLSDIPMVYPVRKMSDETRQSGPTHFKRKSSTTKDTEAQWQDDLTKWKNRRKSSKSDVRRTSVDREHVTNQMTNSANFQKAMSQSGPIKRDQPSQHSPGSHPYSISPTKPSKSNLRPHSRVLLARSNATEMPYNTSSYDSQAHIQGLPGPEMNVLKKDSYVASLASVGVTATTPSVEFTYSSQSHVKTAQAQHNQAPRT